MPQLTALQQLSLHAFHDFDPASLSSLVQLRDLKLEGQVKRLGPGWVSRLAHLTCLDLGQSSINNIPAELAALSRLEVLRLRGRVRQGEDWQVLCQLIRLRELDLSSCWIADVAVPVSFAALVLLEVRAAAYSFKPRMAWRCSARSLPCGNRRRGQCLPVEQGRTATGSSWHALISDYPNTK